MVPRVAVPIGKRISIVAQLIVSTSVWSLASAHYTVVASVTRIGPRTSTAVLLGAHTCTGSDCGGGHLQLARIAQVQREPTASSHGGTVCHRPLISAPLSRFQAVFAGKPLRLAHLAQPPTTVWAPDSAVALCSTGVSGVSQVAACAMKISSIGPSQSRQVSRPARQLSTSGSAAAANSLHVAETLPRIASRTQQVTQNFPFWTHIFSLPPPRCG